MLKYVTPLGKTSPPILKHFISLANREPERAKMKTGIIYSVGLYQSSVVIRGGSEKELK